MSGAPDAVRPPAADTHVDADELATWCREHLGAAPAATLFRSGYLSAVTGLELDDGRRVVVKLRPDASRLSACTAAQRLAFERGFPCPEPLAGPLPLGGLTASAESFVAGGSALPASGRDAVPFAAGLARLVATLPSPAAVGPLDPAPPWTTWRHSSGGLWPWPDDRDFDLNEVDGPRWLDAAAAAARDRLRGAEGDAVLGHGDWWTANLAWVGDDLLVAYDWDSVVADTEASIAGLASAIYPSTGDGTEASVDESAAFLRAYGTAGRPLGDDDIEVAWAAGLWVRAFDAKKQFGSTGTLVSLSEAEAAERRRLAGA